MSAFSIFTAGLALFASVNAYTKPQGDSPNGNPFSQPGLNSVVPAGQNFTVTWQPTTQGSVTLLLLKGDSKNMQIVAPIAENIDNSGTFVWQPSSDLQPGPTAATGYGIELVCDSDGQYQYTTQFGISNDNPSASASSSASASDSSSTSSDSATTASAGATGPASLPTDSASSVAWSNSTISMPASTTAAATSLITSVVTGNSTSATNTPIRPSSTSSAGNATASTNPNSGASALGYNVIGMIAAAGLAALAL